MKGKTVKDYYNLYLGDCLEVMKDIPDRSIDLVLADPPYGITHCKWDTVIPLEPMWQQLNRVSRGSIVLFAGQPFTSVLICSNLRHFKHTWTWEKDSASNFLSAKKMPLKVTEDICVFRSTRCKKSVYNPQMEKGEWRRISKRPTNERQYEQYGKVNFKLAPGGGETNVRYPRNLLRYPIPQRSADIHPTQKPVPLLQYLIQTYSNAGDKVLDFCMGSGSTGVAAITLGRYFVGIEREEKYYKVADRRLKECIDDDIFFANNFKKK